MLLWLASFLVSLFISLSHLCSLISLSHCLIMFTIPMFAYVLSSRILLNPICSNNLLIFLLQKALFSFHLMSLYAIWDNLFSFSVKLNQNLKFLHWASIIIGNHPVSAPHALLLQHLLNPSDHCKNLF